MQARPTYEYVFSTTSLKKYLCEYLVSLAKEQVSIPRNAKQYDVLIMPHGSHIVSMMFSLVHLRKGDEKPLETDEVHIALPYTSERFMRRGNFYLSRHSQEQFQTYIRGLFFNALMQFMSRNKQRKIYTEELICEFMAIHNIESIKFDTLKRYYNREIEKTTRRARPEPEVNIDNFSVKNNGVNQGTLSLIYF